MVNTADDTTSESEASDDETDNIGAFADEDDGIYLSRPDAQVI